MTARDKDNFFRFCAVGKGRPGHLYFLCNKNATTEAEEWLEKTINRVLNNYGADKSKSVLGEEFHIRHEENNRITPKINVYLHGLLLSCHSSETYQEYALSAPPKRKYWHSHALFTVRVKNRILIGPHYCTQRHKKTMKIKSSLSIPHLVILHPPSHITTKGNKTQYLLLSTLYRKLHRTSRLISSPIFRLKLSRPTKVDWP